MMICEQFKELKTLMLISCPRLGNDDYPDACNTTVRLLDCCKKLRVVMIFNTSLINIENKESLFGKFSTDMVCRLIWIPFEWFIADDDDDDGSPPSWLTLLPTVEGIPSETLADQVKQAHLEYYQVLGA